MTKFNSSSLHTHNEIGYDWKEHITTHLHLTINSWIRRANKSLMLSKTLTLFHSSTHIFSFFFVSLVCVLSTRSQRLTLITTSLCWLKLSGENFHRLPFLVLPSTGIYTYTVSLPICYHRWSMNTYLCPKEILLLVS